MIKDENGRTISERTPDEVADMLKKDITSLTPAEREALRVILEDMTAGEKTTADGAISALYEADGPSLFSLLREADYKHDPVDMETFVKDPYYLGATCDVLYPKLLEDLIELFSGDYYESIWTGSIGSGKTFCASIGICRILYELSCMNNPQKSFGLASDANIALVILSVTQDLAMKAAFENITSKIQASPYFHEYFPFQPTQKEIRFPSKVWVAPRATNDTSALGLNVLSYLQDESNFMPKNRKNTAQGVYVDMASQIYTQLRRRIKSRFERRGRVPGMIFVVSSKKSSQDFTAKRVAEAANDPHVFVRDYSTWAVRPEAFGKKRFTVLAGNDTIQSKILTEEETVLYNAKGAPDGAVLVPVPEEYRRDFELDIDGSLNDIAGIASVAIRPFISQRNKIFDAVKNDKERYGARSHPFSMLEWDPSKGGSFVWQRLVRMVQERQGDGRIIDILRPLIDPTAIRHARLDMSLRKDATGFVVAHIGAFKDVVRRDDAGRQYAERAPIIVVDVALRIRPPVGGELLLADNRRLLYELVSHGFAISRVTMDTFQSEDTVQTLKGQGFNAETLSVDRDTGPYETLKNALYEDRLYFYEYQPLIDELKVLQKNIVGSTNKRPKIDHPANGEKDVSDALAGVVQTLTESAALSPTPILRDGQQQAADPWSVGMGAPPQGVSEMGMPLPMLSSENDGREWAPFGEGDDWDWSP